MDGQQLNGLNNLKRNKMTKQTAVEWLIEKLNQCEPMYSSIQSNAQKYIWEKLIKQAKEMEKEQIIEAHGAKQYHKTVSGEQYYNETYKKEKNEINRGNEGENG